MYIDFKKLKARVSIREILVHYGLLTGLEETPQGYQGTCPFCGSNAFKVNTDQNVWFCFGECKSKGEKSGGNVLDFVARKEKVSIQTSATKIHQWFPEEPATTEIVVTSISSNAKADQKEHDHEQGARIEEQGTCPSAELSPQPVAEPSLEGRINKPLGFALKNIDYKHPRLEALAVRSETREEFGVGYFTGKGIMHDHIVFPIENRDGLLVAYAGYL
jgi:hypothetical protein